MQESEFYKNAFEDPVFRREKLEELRYFKKGEAWFIGLSATGFFAHTLYAGLRVGDWEAGVGWLVIASISCAGYAATAARAGALEAIEEREGSSGVGATASNRPMT